MDLKKPNRATLSTQIVESIEQCIKDGVWPVGTKIPGEMELMQEFDVSRNTIREAISSLVHAGILKSQRGDGTYVMSDSRLDAAIQNHLKSMDVKEVLETRLVLESAIVRYACLRSTEEDLGAIRLSYQKRTRSVSESSEEFNQADKEFHFQIAKASHNSLIYDLYESFYCFLDELFGIYYQVSTGDYKQPQEHEALFEAIMARDGERAVAAVQSMIASIQKSFKL